MLRYGLLGLGLLTVGATELMAQRQFAPVVTRPAILLPAPSGDTLAGRAPAITINWQPVPNALDYAVLRSADPAQPGAPVSPAGLTTPSFVDHTAAPGTVFYYTVTARFPSGTSTSAPVRFDPPPAIVKSGLGPRGQTLVTGSTAPADDGMPAITGISDTVVGPGGPPVSIRGRYLWEVTGVYFGTGAHGSYSNPRVVPSQVSQAGDEVQVRAPYGCTSHGPVELEQYGYSGVDPRNILWTPQNGAAASPVRLYCASKPVIQGLPFGVRPGGTAMLQGQYLSWVTQVTNLADGSNLTFQIVDDNQISIRIPFYSAQQYPSGQVNFQPNLISRLGSTSTPVIQILLPPIVSSATAPMLSPAEAAPVEPGGVLEINGFGLAGVPGTITVAVDNKPASRLPNPRPNAIAVTVPSSAVNGTVMVSTLGGTANGTFPIMVGPSRVSSVTPASAPVGARVVVTGYNLFRARGICFTNPLTTPQLIHMPVIQPFVVGLQAPAWQQWTNTSVTVDVPAGAGSGPLVLFIPDAPGATSGACVPATGGPTLQVP